MFTVKHVSPAGGEEIHEAVTVSYMPAMAAAIAHQQTPSTDTFWYTKPLTGEIVSIETGTVYVMNDVGKTIATYRLTPTVREELDAGTARAKDWDFRTMRDPRNGARPDDVDGR